jgi:hypothetical protein
MMPQYKVLPGPEGYLPPAAALMGVELPEEGKALVEGKAVSEPDAVCEIARKILAAKNPTIFPGPLVLWAWSETACKKAQLVKELAAEGGMKIIPMPDYRPKYPMINPAVEINPNHPNLTIWHNKIDVCVFIGVHCHYANVALKIIRGGTDCYTIALCGEYGHEDAMITLRDVTAAKLEKILAAVREAKGKM